MNNESIRVIKTYLALMLLSTFAASFIWGINTLFLLDAGLSITQAFLANAFFTVGQVMFEVPTGVIADIRGRRYSYLLGVITLLLTTIWYYYLWETGAGIIAWSLSSILLGLGFTFFSGATEAWLVDALKFNNFKGSLDNVFAKGQIYSGIAMLSGTILGGVVAQFTNLGVPYLMRIVMLGLTFIIAWKMMHDEGFKPDRNLTTQSAINDILRTSLEYGLKNPPVRWIMLSWPFMMGVAVYAFYAMQPYLLALWGDSSSYAIAGLAAAIVGGTQIGGGYLVPGLRKIFKLRTDILIFGTVISIVSLVVIGLLADFWLVLFALVIWALMFAALMPVRQAYINELVPSKQRATILSSDNLINSSGGAIAQPALGKVADVWSYGHSYVIGGIIQIISLPLILLAKKTKAPSDPIPSQAKTN